MRKPRRGTGAFEGVELWAIDDHQTGGAGVSFRDDGHRPDTADAVN